MKASRSQVSWFRLRRSGLVTRFDSPEVAARNLIGIQAQLPPYSSDPGTGRTIYGPTSARSLIST